jgi:ABC-type Mn2+/Zn2+ transport system ATPase subunit
VDLELGEGQFWFFLGPNGSGKTTLLRALLRQIAPLRGELELDPELAAFERIGFVPQRCELNPAVPTTVREFVELGLVGLKVARAERSERLRTALVDVGLDDAAPRDYGSLSGGQRQRALLARALIRRPRTLLLDEPTSGLDIASEHGLLALLERLNRDEGLTVVVVTHQLALAARYASHVALFRGGSVTPGRRDEVLTEDRLLRAYRMHVHIVEGSVRVRPEHAL